MADATRTTSSYVGEPLKKEVFAELPKIQVGLLEENLKKLSIEDLQKVHVERKKTHEKSYERASERVITLKEQYNKQKQKVQRLIKKKLNRNYLNCKRNVQK